MKSTGGRIAVLLLGLVLAAAYLPGQAKKNPDQSPQPTRPSRAVWGGIDAAQLLRAIDSDEDGVITRDEWDRYFRDHNKDDQMTLEELQPSAASKEATSEALNPDYERLKAFERLDANKNDTIERSEWPGNDRTFSRIDANRDGVINREEFLSRNARFWTLRFEDCDFNGDGIITRSEWLDSEVSFSRLDHDHNGVIDRFEFYTPE